MKKYKQPRLGTARNSRKFTYKYYYNEKDRTKRVAVPAGRCVQCNKITDCYCDECGGWCCAKHLTKIEKKDREICPNCSENLL